MLISAKNSSFARSSILLSDQKSPLPKEINPQHPPPLSFTEPPFFLLHGEWFSMVLHSARDVTVTAWRSVRLHGEDFFPAWRIMLLVLVSLKAAWYSGGLFIYAAVYVLSCSCVCSLMRLWGLVCAPTLSRMQPLCLWQHVEKKIPFACKKRPFLWCKTDSLQKWQLRGWRIDAQIGGGPIMEIQESGCQCCCQFSFPLFNARWKCIKNGANGWWSSSQWCNCTFILIRISVHSSPKSSASPFKNLVHPSSKIWCIPPFKNPIIPPSKIWSSFPLKIWCILLKIWSSFSSKKVQHDQNSSSVPQESAKNPSFHTCFHLATVEILQYVDYPDLSHVCWPLTILAWWYLSFLYRILSKSLYLVMIFSPWWLQVSCKN